MPFSLPLFEVREHGLGGRGEGIIRFRLFWWGGVLHQPQYLFFLMAGVEIHVFVVPATNLSPAKAGGRAKRSLV